MKTFLLAPRSYLGRAFAVAALGLAVGAQAMADVRGLNSNKRVPGEYIVVMKKDIAASKASRLAAVQSFANYVETSFQAKVSHQYQNVLPGFVVNASEAAISELAKDENVAFVEANQYVSINEIQPNATWGIDRIDSRTGSDSSYFYTATGQGVSAYVIDTGLHSTHVEFTGRVGEGFSVIDDGQGTNDCNGHGTHVSGTLGGTEYGVAKDVTLHPVRVLNCQGSGTIAGVLEGVDWVAANATLPAVANMSLGGSASAALDVGIANAVDTGVVFVVAAGNSNGNACSESPAREDSVITVGATTQNDQRAAFSNFGPCVDIFAPGAGITSSFNSSDTATKALSGTSMASPHVAGAVALLLEQFPSESPDLITRRLVANSEAGIVSNPGVGSPDRFLYTAPEGSAEPAPNPFESLGDKVTHRLKEAVAMGNEADGKDLYGCVTIKNGEFIPGKYGTHLSACNIALDGVETQGFTFNFVTGSNASWVSASTRSLPAGSIVYGSHGGSDLYLCRAKVFDGLHLGQVTDNGDCLIPYGGNVESISSFEVLVAD
ncbi:MAG: DUF3421 domain-containing protein [Exilibacterium sp.]